MTRYAWIIIFSVLLALQVGTQVLAHEAHEAPALGAPWLVRRVLRHPYAIYAPWQGPVWVWRWGRQAPQAVWRAVYWASVPLVAGTVLGLLLWAAHRQPQWPPPMTGHGSGRWAGIRDIKKAGLL
jgi:type IV secretory pathway TraG/TraD family ATPase VirD4